MEIQNFYNWAKEYFSPENYPSYLSNRDGYSRGYREGVLCVWNTVMKKLEEVNVPDNSEVQIRQKLTDGNLT